MLEDEKPHNEIINNNEEDSSGELIELDELDNNIDNNSELETEEEYESESE